MTALAAATGWTIIITWGAAAAIALLWLGIHVAHAVRRPPNQKEPR